MNTVPKISVIMTCYNEKKEWIVQSIESILNQTFKDFEFIIVLDNPESEELKQLLVNYKKKDDRINLIFNEKNEGLVSSLNKAIKVSRGLYLARMDSDDISYFDRFEKQVNYLDNNQEIALVAGIGVIIDEDGKEMFQTNKLGITSKKAEKSLIHRNIFFHPAWMFRRSVLKDLIKYNDLPRTEDLDFLCRLILAGYKIKNLSENVIKVRIRKNGITNSNNLYQIRAARIIMNNYKQCLLNNKEYRPLEEIKKLIINKKEIKNYSKACYLYTESLSDLRNKRIFLSIKKLVKCFLLSKDKRLDFYSTIRIKVINI